MTTTTPSRRIVCLVPSLTEALFDLGAGDRVVGVTEFCTSPAAAAAAPRVGGPKTPDIGRITSLNPDLIILSTEENCVDHLKLCTRLCEVYIARCGGFEDGLAVVTELGARVGAAGSAAMIVARMRRVAERIAAQAAERAASRSGATALTAFYPVWRDPWITAGGGTFAAEMLRRAGAVSLFEELPVAYPRVTLDEVRARRPRLVLLPDEPYAFAPADVRLFTAHDFEATRRGAVACLPGRWAAWYGTRMDVGLEGLTRLIHDLGRAWAES